MRDSKNLKPEKKQHDHTFTDCLKAIIFSLVMLAPIFSIAVRCGYIMFNKNAFESYSGETIETYTQVNNSTNFIVGNEYLFTSGNVYTGQSFNSNAFVFYELPNNINSSNANMLNAVTQGNNFIFSVSNGSKTIRIYNDNNLILEDGVNLDILTFNFTLTGYTTNLTNFSMFSYKNESSNKLDNAFTYGISNLKNENVFNWTQNTAIYTPIQAMCTGLGITEDAISIMLTYWILMIAIYIIVDMIVWIFTKLTHILQ